MAYEELANLELTPYMKKKEYEKRINSPSAIQMDFLNGGQLATQPPLFIYNLPKLTYLVSQLYRQSSKLSLLYTELKPLEQEEVIDYLLIEELLATHKLANREVKRKEISQLLQKSKENIGNPNDYSLNTAYFLIASNAIIDLTKLDFLTSEDNSLSSKHVDFFGGDKLKNFPPILTIMLAHYLFIEKTSGKQDAIRFIYSYQLSQELDTLSALLISQSILDDSELYQYSFSTLNKSSNFNEATFFVIAHLTLLLNKQKKLISKLEENKKLRQRVKKKLKDELGNIPFAFEVFEIYFDHALYYPNELLSRKSILSFAHKDISSYMMRKIEALLLEKKLIEKRGEKPVTYRLNPTVIAYL